MYAESVRSAGGFDSRGLQSFQLEDVSIGAGYLNWGLRSKLAVFSSPLPKY